MDHPAPPLPMPILEDLLDKFVSRKFAGFLVGCGLCIGAVKWGAEGACWPIVALTGAYLGTQGAVDYKTVSMGKKP